MVTVKMTEQEHEEWINQKCAIIENSIDHIGLDMHDIILTISELKKYVDQLETDVNNSFNFVNQEKRYCENSRRF